MIIDPWDFPIKPTEIAQKDLRFQYHVCIFHLGNADRYSGGNCRVCYRNIDVDGFRDFCCYLWRDPYDRAYLQHWYDKCPFFRSNWTKLQKQAEEKGEVLRLPQDYE